MRRPAISALALAAALAAVTTQTQAQTYPSQTINVYVAFAAGGVADTIGRIAATKLGERLKQNVVVENRGGAGGNLAARAVATAAADGYTLLATTSALAVNDTASKNKGYETFDLRPVAFVAFSPDVIAVHPSNPAKTLKELVQNSKNKPFSYGSAGVGTGPHIGAEYFFKEIAKANATHVPFSGGAPAVSAALGNHVDGVVLTLPTVTPHILSGKLRGIGLTGEKRSGAVPDVPTYSEAGFGNFATGSWVGLFVPAKTPEAVVTRLRTELAALSKDGDVQARLSKLGFEPMAKSPAELDGFFKQDVAAWGKMVKSVGFSN
jgi:tripartite-type tricarboxylate transporter receptor subunit TctC